MFEHAIYTPLLRRCSESVLYITIRPNHPAEPSLSSPPPLPLYPRGAAGRGGSLAQWKWCKGVTAENRGTLKLQFVRLCVPWKSFIVLQEQCRSTTPLKFDHDACSRTTLTLEPSRPSSGASRSRKHAHDDFNMSSSLTYLRSLVFPHVLRVQPMLGGRPISPNDDDPLRSLHVSG